MTVSAPDFEYIRKYIYDRSRIVLDPGKEYLVESRLNPILQERGWATMTDLVHALQSEPPNGLHHRVVEAMTTNETSFMRDLHPFDTLKRIVLPDFIQKRSTERALNMWCAASSSGQEPYSILMVMFESFPTLRDWALRFVATDIHQDMLKRTRDGRYSQLEVNRGLPAPFLIRYFQKIGIEWQVREELRRHLDLRQVNLAQSWPAMQPMDIVFMRNVLIYFDADTKRDIFRRLAMLLKPDGYLFLGGSETTFGLSDRFERLPNASAGVYRLRR